ncbi:hypothetical protein FRB95_010957 [Tulasnella sp. JGI-2019a]|nr:hypothetical protein FRB95_010957 [Tulasnella sp. JGI-2019a]
MFNKLWPLSSSTPPQPRTEEDEATVNRDAEQSHRREQYIQRGRQHNGSIGRGTSYDDDDDDDNDDDDDDDDDEDTVSAFPAKQDLKFKRMRKIGIRLGSVMNSRL